MIVYFEGVDGSGKSTIIRKLQEEFGYDVVTPPQSMYNKSQECVSWEYFASEYDNKIILCDRGFISEFVYRLVDDEVTFLTLELFARLLTNCKIVHCISPTSFTDAQERGEDNIVTFEQHKRIEQLYFDTMSMINKFTKIPILTFDWHNQNTSDVIKFINSNKEKL